MNYTDWKNLPDKSTPLTAENLLNDINNLKKEISEIEYDSNENGEYIKFPNGIMICIKTEKMNIDIQNQSGSLYYSGYNLSNTKLPANFVETPFYDNASITCDYNFLLFVTPVGNVSITDWYSRIYIGSQSSRESAPITLKYIAIGKWK